MDSPTSYPPQKRVKEDFKEEEMLQKKIRLCLNKKNTEDQKVHQFSQGNSATSPFQVTTGPLENYFTLDVLGGKGFHKSEVAQEVTYRAKLKYLAPNKTITDLAPIYMNCFKLW